VRRISIRNKKFSIVGHGQRTTMDANFKDIVVVDMANVSRVYYEGEYEQNVQKAPTCWSVDNQRPAEGVLEENKQANRCLDCTHNIRGSGQNRGRACKFIQNIAVAFEGQFDTMYRLKLPATSIYGKAKGGHLPMQEYMKFLSSRGSEISSVLTRMYFDSSSNVPKLFFKPMRSLTGEELSTVSEMQNHVDTHMAISFIVIPNSPFDVTEGFELNAT
jgi:hypothetical protein